MQEQAQKKTPQAYKSLSLKVGIDVYYKYHQ